jgi:hypothetical protein
MVSVIAVNYNSAHLLRECLSSIAAAVDGTPFECIAVDSGSRESDVRMLRDLKGDNLALLLNKENIGYAKAVNQGLSHAKGDVVLISNPDMLYKPGSIHRMMKTLEETPRCGAVGPRTWWDKEMRFLLPVSEFVTPYRMFRDEIMKGSRVVYEAILKGWVKKKIRYWLTETPLEQEMLSGACIMTTRRLIEKVGGFDEKFPLYFEDTDWFLRVRKAGYSLFLEPRAAVIHYYNQSAQKERDAAQQKFDYSLNLFLRKHYAFHFPIVNAIIKLRGHVHNRIYPLYDDMGRLTSPPDFSFSDTSEKLLLLSPVYSMIPSAGSFFKGNTFRIPEELWKYLGEGRYFVKAFILDGLKECGAWTWVKSNS